MNEPYKVLVHLRPSCSLNKLCYTEKEMALAARSLAGKPIFTNHSPKPVGMYIHADWSPERNEVLGVGALTDKHLWDEIKLHGKAPVSQRTHYFTSKKVGGFKYPEGIVFDEVSLIVDEEQAGKPQDYVEVLESWHAVMHSQLEHAGAIECRCGQDEDNKEGEKKLENKGAEKVIPPKLNPLIPFNQGRFAGPEPKPSAAIRNVGEITRYGQGYSEPPALATIDLPAKYGPPLNYARIRGGPGADIPFPASRVQKPSTDGQPSAEPTAKPHMEKEKEPAVADPEEAKKKPFGKDDDHDDDDNNDNDTGETVWTMDYISKLPDRAFATARKYPHHKRDLSIDLPHLAAQRLIASRTGDKEASTHLEDHLKEYKLGQYNGDAEQQKVWDRMENSYEPFVVIESALSAISEQNDALAARITTFIDEAMNKEFAKHKIGEFMRMFGPNLVRLEMDIRELKECRDELKSGQPTTTIDTEAVIEGVLDKLNQRAREIARTSIPRGHMQPLMGQHVALEYASATRKNALRQMGFNIDKAE